MYYIIHFENTNIIYCILIFMQYFTDTKCAFLFQHNVNVEEIVIFKFLVNIHKQHFSILFSWYHVN